MNLAEEKIGAGHLQGMVRSGAKEFAQILPAFPESVRPVEEPGLAGNLTPQEVLHDKGKDGLYQDWLASRAQQVAEREPQQAEMGREM